MFVWLIIETIESHKDLNSSAGIGRSAQGAPLCMAEQTPDDLQPISVSWANLSSCVMLWAQAQQEVKAV